MSTVCRRCALLGVLLALLQPMKSRAGGFTFIEIGGRQTGTLTAVAKPDDLSAVYHNPAGLAGLRGTRVHLSSGFTFMDLSMRVKAWPSGPGAVEDDGNYGSEDFISTPVDEDGYFQGDIHPSYNFGAMPMLAASTDLGIDGGPVWALGIYSPEVVAAFFPEDAPSRYMLTEGLYTAGVASLSAAYRLLDWLDLGASLGLFYLRLDGQRWINRAVPGGGDLNADVVVRMVGEDYRFYFNFGVCARLLPGLTLGLSFTSGSEIDLLGKLEVGLPPGWEEDDLLKALVDAEVLMPGRYAMHARMSLPYGIAAGLNWEVLEELELSADFRYWFYQTYEQMDIFHDFSIDLGTEEPLVPNPMTFEKQFGGSWSLSVGVLGRPLAIPLELMAGWNYKLSPAPSRTKSLDSPEMTSTGASLGVRYTFWETFRVSATYYRYWFLNYDVTDSILDPPQNIQFNGGLNTFSVVLELML